MKARALKVLATSLLVPLAAATASAQDFFDRAPFLQQLTFDSVVIVSQSANATGARCRHGLAGSALETVLEENEATNDHVFVLEGLSPATSYDYEVDHGEESWTGSFRTLPMPGGTIRAAVFGDSGWRTGPDLGVIQDKVRDVIEGFQPDLLLHTGDLAYPAGHAVTYQAALFEVYTDLLARAALYPTPGNHDCQLDVDFYRDAFHLPENGSRGAELDYSFDAGDAHFVVLNTCTRGSLPELRDWLNSDLKATSQEWKIVYFHHPPYSVGRHGGEGWVEQEVVPLLEELGVDLVFSGHEHVYERSYPVRDGRTRDGHQDPNFVAPEGIVYVVTGGGGGVLHDEVEGGNEAVVGEHAPLFPVVRSIHHAVSLEVGPDRLEVRAVDLDGNLIDRFSIEKGDSPRPIFRYVAGDADSSGSVTINDPIAVLQFLFSSGVEICDAASDVNGNDRVSLTDAIQTLSALFLGMPNDAEPIGTCVTPEPPDTTGCKAGCP